MAMNAAGQAPELKLSCDIWPPFTDVKENKSILTVLVQEALYRREINSEIIIEDWGKVLTKIDKGEFDGTPALWETPERMEKYHFSKPFLYSQLGLDVTSLAADKDQLAVQKWF